MGILPHLMSPLFKDKVFIEVGDFVVLIGLFK